MPEDRRSAHRALAPGMRVTYEESASGTRTDGEVLDVGSGGLFVRCASPVPAGKRLSLEIRQVEGDTPWSAIVRVVWTRPQATEQGPAGMGAKWIDADDALIATIERLVAQAPKGPSAGTPTAPARERTVHGVGLPPEPLAPVAPILPVAPAREATVLGLGTAGPMAARPPSREPSQQEPPPEGWDVPDAQELPTREIVVPQILATVAPQPKQPPAHASEPSVAFDLVPKKPDVAVVARRRGGRWLLLVSLLAIAAAAGLYTTRSRIPWVQRLVDSWTASPVAPAPVAPPPPAPTATATPSAVPTPTPTAPASPSVAGTTTEPAIPSHLPDASPVPSNAPTARVAPPVSSAVAPAKKPAVDNPY